MTDKYEWVEIELSALDTELAGGVVIPSKLVKQYITPDKIFYCENKPPSTTQGESHDSYIQRAMTVNLNNTCCVIKDLYIDSNNILKAKMKPSGRYADVFYKQLTEANGKKILGVRGISEVVIDPDGTLRKELVSIVTWDYNDRLVENERTV